MTEPSFICIGFQKCGTTSLYDLLKQHPLIYLTEDVKEPMFYRAPFFRLILGAGWYHKRYFGHLEEARRQPAEIRRQRSEGVGLLTGRRGGKNGSIPKDSAASGRAAVSEGMAASGRIADSGRAAAFSGASETSAPVTLYPGEINAGLAFNGCARWLGRDFSRDTRLIFMMRDPADRCYSAYKYFLALGFLPMSVVADDRKRGYAAAFDSYVRSVLLNPRRRRDIMRNRMHYLCFSQGNYARCIREYLRYFPRENMKFIFFEEFVQDEEGVTRELLDFLQIPEAPGMSYNVKSNETNFRPVSPIRSKFLRLLQGTFYLCYEFLDLSRRCPGFFRRFMSFFDWSMSTCTRPETDTSKMLPSTRRLLNRYYRREMKQVEKLAGRKLPDRWGRDC